MMSAGMTLGSTVFNTVAAKIPSRPVMRVESTQLAPAKNSGEKPSTTAPFSFSEAARVARPKRVSWNSAYSAAVSTITSTVMAICSDVMLIPKGNLMGLPFLKNGIDSTA